MEGRREVGGRERGNVYLMLLTTTRILPLRNGKLAKGI